MGRLRMRIGLAAATLFTLALAAGDVRADGNGTLGFFRAETGKVNYVTAMTLSTQSGSINLTGIPAGAALRGVYLYYTVIRGSVATSLTFNGTTMVPFQIGMEGAGSNTRRWYRNDVSALVAGNASFPFTVVASGNLRGAGLLAIFTDPSLSAHYTIEIHDGADFGLTAGGADGVWPVPVTFSHFFVDGSSPPEVDVGYLLQDGVGGSLERYLLNGAVVAGDDPANSGFEFDRVVVANGFAGGETSATGNIYEISDALSLGAMVLHARSSPAISDTTAPQITALAPSSGSIVASSPAQLTLHVQDESASTVLSSPPAAWTPSSFPAPSSGDATASFALSEGVNAITITSTDALGLSTSVTTSLILDSIAPQVTIISPADGVMVASNSIAVAADVSDATATDVVSVPAGVSGLVPAGGGSLTGIVALQEGANVITVSANDEAGHMGGTSITVVRDTIAPQMVVTSPADGSVLADSPAVVSVMVIETNASVLMIGSHSMSLPAGGGVVTDQVALTAGMNIVPITLTDAAQNSSSLSLQLTLDQSAPVVTINAPINGACYGPSVAIVPVVGTVDDVSATMVTSVPTGVSGELAAGGGIVSGAVVLQEGLNAISLQASDATGRTGMASVVVVLDATAPIVTLDSPADGAAVRGVVEVSASATDASPGSQVHHLDLALDGRPIGTFMGSALSTSLDSTQLADGLHLLTVTAFDGMGNQSAYAASIVADNTAPIVAIPVPVDGAFVAGLVAFEAQVTDTASGLAAVDMAVAGSAPNAADGSKLYELPPRADVCRSEDDTRLRSDGAVTLMARARDAAGNESVASITVVVDNSASQSLLVAPSNGAEVCGVIPISASGVRLKSLEILVDGVLVAKSNGAPVDVRYDTRRRLDGSMTVAAIGIDRVGNHTVSVATVTVDNISVEIRPRVLSRHYRSGDRLFAVELKGASVNLLLPADSHSVELRVPGGSPVRGCIDWNERDDRRGRRREVKSLRVLFDRQQLLAAIEAGIATGVIEHMAEMPVSVVADQAFILGVERLRLGGRCDRR